MSILHPNKVRYNAMKKNYVNAQIEITYLESKDVVALSEGAFDPGMEDNASYNDLFIA